MKLNSQQEQFIKNNKEILSELFLARKEELKDMMVEENDEKERSKIRELILEFQRWLIDIGIASGETKMKRDNFI